MGILSNITALQNLTLLQNLSNSTGTLSKLGTGKTINNVNLGGNVIGNLENNTLNGEKIRQTFYILTDSSNSGTQNELDLPDVTMFRCGQCYNVFASVTDSSEFKNDKTPLLYKFPATATVKFYLQKYTDGVFIDAEELKDNTYGVFTATGTITDYKNNLYQGYLLYWNSVINDLGSGYYRIRIEETNMSVATDTYTDEYCLSEYDKELVNGTVRIDATISGIIGDINNKETLINFGSGWYQQIRLDGFFGYDTSSFTKEFNEYRTGQKKPYKVEQTIKYTLKLKPILGAVHNILKTYYFMADEIMITDYNKNMPDSHILEKVLLDSDYEPVFEKDTLLREVEVKFISAYNNLRKRL